MTIEQEVAALTTKTTELLDAVTGVKTRMDNATSTAEQAVVDLTAAQTAVTTATAQATVATNQAGIATTKAGEAATSASTASDAATALASAMGQYRAIHLGNLAADPTVDGNGNPLAEGAEYFNTTTDKLRVYNGAAWADYDATAQTATANAALSAASASTSAGAALNSETAAAASALLAVDSADSAAASAAIAGDAATVTANKNAAAESASAAALSETNAKASEDAAALSETASGESEIAAAASASTASTKATDAVSSATTATGAATTATTKAGEASTSATNAATSEANALTSASTASGAATTATTKAGEASTSATNAATSEANAAASATIATTKAGEASASASSAALSESTATTQAQVATTQAANSATSASNAAISAETAATQAGNATTQAGIATTAATGASVSASTATAQAQAATTSAGNAALSASESELWASGTPNVEVESGLYSARHYAQMARASVIGTLIYRGGYDASVGDYPSSPELGDYYKITTAGTIGIIDFTANDSLIYNGTGWDKIDNTESVTSVNGETGIVVLTKTSVGLGNVDNTADLDKPISTATQSALDGKSDTGHTHTGTYEPADSNIQSHISNGANPHSVTASQVGFSNKATLDKITESAGAPLWNGGAWPGAGGTGVSIAGDTTIYVTQSKTYTITNYNAFSSYSVSATAGTVSITGDAISFTAPASAQTVTLAITKDTVATEFSLVVQAAGVTTPTNVSPTNGATNQNSGVTLTASDFAWLGLSDTHASSDWQVATDADFATIVASATADATNKTSWSATGLSVSQTYYWRVRYNGASNGSSAWSAASSFATKASFNDYIATPAPTPANFGDPLDGGFYVGMFWNQIAQSTDSKALATGTQTFAVPDMSGSPIVYGGQTLEIRSRANPANKFIGTVIGAQGTTLTLNVSSIGGSGTFSDWSIMSRFRSIVAPKSSGENAGIAIKNANTALPTACQTLTEGLAATEAMKNADTSTVYPAAHWARGLSIGGKADWYIPARDELELHWRNLKPTTDSNDISARPAGQIFDYKNLGSYGDTAATHGTNNNSSPTGATYTASVPAQTAATAFRTGGSEAFEYGSAIYWSSSEYNAANAWRQNWRSSNPGSQGSNSKTPAYRVRAVRRSII